MVKNISNPDLMSPTASVNFLNMEKSQNVNDEEFGTAIGNGAVGDTKLKDNH